MICDGSCEPECYGCSMRNKGLQVSPAAMPNRRNHNPGTRAQPNWEKGVIYDERPDGSRMPIFEPGRRTPLHVKQYAEQRHDIDAQIKNLKSRTEPLPATT